MNLCVFKYIMVNYVDIDIRFQISAESGDRRLDIGVIVVQVKRRSLVEAAGVVILGDAPGASRPDSQTDGQIMMPQLDARNESKPIASVVEEVRKVADAWLPLVGKVQAMSDLLKDVSEVGSLSLTGIAVFSYAQEF